MVSISAAGGHSGGSATAENGKRFAGIRRFNNRTCYFIIVVCFYLVGLSLVQLYCKRNYWQGLPFLVLTFGIIVISVLSSNATTKNSESINVSPEIPFPS